MAYAEIVRERCVLRQPDRRPGRASPTWASVPRAASAQRRCWRMAEQKVFALRQGDAKAQGQYHSMPPLLDHISKSAWRCQGQEPGGLARACRPASAILDAETTGLHPGDLVIVAGRPAMGKTWFAMNIAEHVAIVDLRYRLRCSAWKWPAEQLVFARGVLVRRHPTRQQPAQRADGGQRVGSPGLGHAA